MSSLDDYLELMYPHTGYVHAAVGVGIHRLPSGAYKHTKWIPRCYEWPKQAKLLIDLIDTAKATGDVYACPYVHTSRVRAKGGGVRDKVHADIDHDLDADLIREHGGIVVHSGTEGHGYGYVLLDRELTLEQHEVVCRSWVTLLGADAKFTDENVLRVPFTFNHKPTVDGGLPAPVTWEPF